MCGIYGIMGQGILDTDLQVLKQLARCSVVRGEDGAGMFQGAAYHKTANYTVEKTAQEISYLLWYHERAKGGDRTLFNSTVDNFFCGHVRAATKGLINDKNSHPFNLDTLVGMHNGTLEYSDYNPGKNETDSEMMFKDMEKRGIKKVLAGLSKKSAYAVVIFDKVKKEFIFARNDQRPLFCAWNENRRVFYWASEVGMLGWVLDRNGIKRSKICSFSPGIIHRFAPMDVNSGKKPTWILERVDEPVAVSVKPFTEYSITPAEVQKPVLKVVENKPAPLPQQQKAKEKNKKGSEVSQKPTERPVMPRNNLHVLCEGCYKDMDLLAKYLGNELRPGEYLCKECDLEYENVGKAAGFIN